MIFHAIWCSDCRTMKPMWRNLRLQFSDLKIKEYDYSDTNHDIPAIINTYHIHDLPTVIFLDKNNNELSRLAGLQHRDSIIDLITKYKNL